MRILKVWDSEYPWDVRTEKMCAAMTEMGHEVHMVARNRRREPLVDVLDECTVHRMVPWPKLGRRVDAASQFPAFFNPRWANLIRRTAVEQKVDGIMVRDIPLGPTALRVGSRLGLPVILDMAENYAAMIRDFWTTGTTKFGDSVVRNPKVIEAVERWVVRRVDHTIVVVQESRDRLVALGASPDRISIVSNTPDRSRVERFSANDRSPKGDASESPTEAGDSNELKLVYLGLMEEQRGVRCVIEAVAAARVRGVPVTLDLIGEGRSRGDFTSRAQELGLSEDVVRFHGFVEYDKALKLVSRADAGLIPHFANESWQTTIPNKLFDYMSLGLPVISSDPVPICRVLSETRAGLTFRDRDVEDLARVIVDFYQMPDRHEMGALGRSAILSQYHWERDAAVLEETLEKVFRR